MPNLTPLVESLRRLRDVPRAELDARIAELQDELDLLRQVRACQELLADRDRREAFVPATDMAAEEAREAEKPPAPLAAPYRRRIADYKQYEIEGRPVTAFELVRHDIGRRGPATPQELSRRLDMPIATVQKAVSRRDIFARNPDRTIRLRNPPPLVECPTGQDPQETAA